ncbi:MAG TPA: 4'-phosphopantetheinyl transferase superfamily protein [Thermoanaerobaculia bacterium]|nr:4'-phosphopantetheinyl transferase superfamily protein [Thermoanaerobaculia bacterium]
MKIAAPWDARALIAFSPPQRGEGGRRPDEGFFTETELATANAFKLASRREEWLLVRIAAKQLAMQLGLAKDPRAIVIDRPSLIIDGVRSEWHVSLSHSAPYAAAAVDRRPIGIDIEHLRELDERAAHLFLTPDEIEQMQSCTLAHRILHFWSAKEAAWKQRSEEFVTLRQVPLQLVEERGDGLLFDIVESVSVGDAIAAITLPTS